MGCRPLQIRILLIALLLGTQSIQSATGTQKSRLLPGASQKAPDKLSSEQLRDEVIRFGDEYLVRLSNSMPDFESDGLDTGLRAWVRRSMLSNGTAVFDIGAGDRPFIGLLDLVVLVSLMRAEVENYWMPNYFGDKLVPVVQALEALEADIWKMADRALADLQVTELKNLIEQWIAQNPEVKNTSYIRFREFLDLVPDQEAVKAKGKGSSGSIFSLLYLDPLAGLDPTVRAIEESKAFAERVMYYGQRLPFVLRMHSQLFLNDIAEADEVEGTLDSIERFSFAAESMSKSLEKLPDAVAAEREAIFEMLMSEEANLNATLVELRATLESGTAMSDSLDQTLTTFEALMASFESDPDEVNDPDSPPFQILEYAETAEQIGIAADRLNVLIASINEDTPVLMESTAKEIRALLTHAFILCVALVGVIFFAFVGYRKWVAVPR